MDAEAFVRALKDTFAKGVRTAVIQELEKPAGRRPDPEMVRMSEWFGALSSDEKDRVGKIIGSTLDHTVFGVTCLLDGVRNVNEELASGRLVLTLIRPDGTQITLSDTQNGTMLNEIYRQLET